MTPTTWLKKINNVLFCIEDDIISYNDLLNGKYDDKLKLHMDTNAREMTSFMSPQDWQYVIRCIEKINKENNRIFN